MKVSLNLAQYYSNVDLKGIAKDVLIKRVGAQLGAVEEIIDWSDKLKGAVMVRVVACDKHADADKLSICRIDDGGKIKNADRGRDGYIQVVCGAPNVKANMFAAWLPVGAKVPNSTQTDPLVLEARQIRGVVSNGMLASAHELGINDDHSGILEIASDNRERSDLSQSKEPVPGEPLTNYLGLDDLVIDCENKMFTHRPDCFGNLGVARELAGISGLRFKSPDWYLNQPKFESSSQLSLEVKNEITNLVPRFMAVVMNNIQVGPSPLWLQSILARVGIKSINNVVDVTNYIMHLTGQPLHAFDYDKLKNVSSSPSLMPRLSKKGEKLNLLGQKQIVLTGEEIVIATDSQAVGLAGVMGGADTEVDASTKNIVIECATFDMYSIRRTSMRYGLFTDAVTRFNKGQSSLQNDRVLWYAMKNMSELAGAMQASNVFDISQPIANKEAIRIGVPFINERLGSNISANDIAALLKNVEFEVESDGSLVIKPPFWRTDVEVKEDVVEEIGRLYGYDKLPVILPARNAKPAPKNDLIEFKQALRSKLKIGGANELLTYSFVHGDLMRKTGTDPDKWAYHIRNAISPDLQYYRTSLLPSLLSKIHTNIKTQAGDDNNQFAIFEIGKTHIKGHNDKEDLPVQNERLALVVTADDKTALNNQHGSAFYLAKKYLEVLVEGQAVYGLLDKDDYPISSAYLRGRSATVTVGDETLGVIGELKPLVAKQLKLPKFCAGFELDIELLRQQLKTNMYQPLPAFPGTQQDLTLEVDGSVTVMILQNVLNKVLVGAKEYRCNLEIKDIFQPEGSAVKRFTFRLHIYHPAKTMTTDEASGLVVELVKAASTQLKATQV